MEKDIDRFVKLVMSPEAKSLMTLFFGMTDLKKNPYKNKARNVKKLAVLGTGLMGSGIASVSAPVCDTILMKDMSIDAAARGINEVWKGIAKQVKSGAVRTFDGSVLYGKLVPCDDYSRFKGTDIVIEAVFEDVNLKRKILKDVEEATDKNTIFASNTSALPIQSIAKGCRRPENVIGMHYFSPVPRMPLLEIIKTNKTAAWVTATALELGIQQGKTCIIVKDGPGFYTTRILAPLLLESGWVIVGGRGVSRRGPGDAELRLSGRPHDAPGRGGHRRGDPCHRGGRADFHAAGNHRAHGFCGSVQRRDFWDARARRACTGMTFRRRRAKSRSIPRCTPSSATRRGKKSMWKKSSTGSA